MATILAFKPARMPREPRSAAHVRATLPATASAAASFPPSQTAEIVFFTGIRYERWDDAVDHLQLDASGNVTVRRDRLEVGE